MTAASMPPIGAQVRAVTRHLGGTVVTVEGTVTGHLDEDLFVVGKPVGTMVRLTPDGPRAVVTVDVLSMPLPPEPPNHAFVHIVGASGVGATAAQRVGRDGGRVDRWFLIGSERARKWAEICELGTVTSLRQDPAASAPDMPWSIKDRHGDELTFKANAANDRLMVGINDGGNDYVNLHPNDAAAAGRALLRWAGEQR